MNLYSYSYGGQKSKVGLTGLVSRCGQGCVPYVDPREESIFLPFPAPGDYLHFVAYGPHPPPKPEMAPEFSCCHFSLVLIFLLFSYPFRGNNDYIGPTWNNPGYPLLLKVR